MLYQQIASNKRKTLVVIVLYMALFVAVGIGIGYYALNNAVAGVIIALVAGGLYSMMMIANATNVVMQLNHAREITDKSQAPMIWNIVSDRKSTNATYLYYRGRISKRVCNREFSRKSSRGGDNGVIRTVES